MGNTNSRDDLPDLPQSIVSLPTVGTQENSDGLIYRNAVEHVRVNLKNKNIAIYVYPKTIVIELNDKSIHISFKYKSVEIVDMNIYLGLKARQGRLPELSRTIFTYKIDNVNEGVVDQVIEIESDDYNKVFYNEDKNYIPIGVVLGSDKPCFLITCGFSKNGSKICMNKNSYVVVDTAIHEIKEMYSMGRDNENVCCICYTEQCNIILSPCYHRCVCNTCVKGLGRGECPVCRTGINGLIEIANQKS